MGVWALSVACGADFVKDKGAELHATRAQRAIEAAAQRREARKNELEERKRRKAARLLRLRKPAGMARWKTKKMTATPSSTSGAPFPTLKKTKSMTSTLSRPSRTSEGSVEVVEEEEEEEGEEGEGGEGDDDGDDDRVQTPLSATGHSLVDSLPMDPELRVPNALADALHETESSDELLEVESSSSSSSSSDSSGGSGLGESEEEGEDAGGEDDGVETKKEMKKTTSSLSMRSTSSTSSSKRKLKLTFAPEKRSVAKIKKMPDFLRAEKKVKRKKKKKEKEKKKHSRGGSVEAKEEEEEEAEAKKEGLSLKLMSASMREERMKRRRAARLLAKRRERKRKRVPRAWHTINVLGVLEGFGERAVALGKGEIRNASVVADTPALILTIPGAVYRRVAAEKRRRETERSIRAIQAVPSLRTAFDDEAIRVLAESSTIRRITPGDILLRQNQPLDSFFVVLDGLVLVRRRVPVPKELADGIHQLHDASVLAEARADSDQTHFIEATQAAGARGDPPEGGERTGVHAKQRKLMEQQRKKEKKGKGKGKKHLATSSSKKPRPFTTILSSSPRHKPKSPPPETEEERERRELKERVKLGATNALDKLIAETAEARMKAEKIITPPKPKPPTSPVPIHLTRRHPRRKFSRGKSDDSTSKSSSSPPPHPHPQPTSLPPQPPPTSALVLADIEELGRATVVGFVDLLAMFASQELPPPGTLAEEAQKIARSRTLSGAGGLSIVVDSDNGSRAGLRPKKPPASGRRIVKKRGSERDPIPRREQPRRPPTSSSSSAIPATSSFTVVATAVTTICEVDGRVVRAVSRSEPRKLWASLLQEAERIPSDDLVRARLAQNFSWDVLAVRIARERAVVHAAARARELKPAAGAAAGTSLARLEEAVHAVAPLALGAPMTTTGSAFSDNDICGVLAAHESKAAHTQDATSPKGSKSKTVSFLSPTTSSPPSSPPPTTKSSTRDDDPAAGEGKKALEELTAKVESMSMSSVLVGVREEQVRRAAEGLAKFRRKHKTTGARGPHDTLRKAFQAAMGMPWTDLDRAATGQAVSGISSLAASTDDRNLFMELTGRRYEEIREQEEAAAAASSTVWGDKEGGKKGKTVGFAHVVNNLVSKGSRASNASSASIDSASSTSSPSSSSTFSDLGQTRPHSFRRIPSLLRFHRSVLAAEREARRHPDAVSHGLVDPSGAAERGRGSLQPANTREGIFLPFSVPRLVLQLDAARKRLGVDEPYLKAHKARKEASKAAKTARIHREMARKLSELHKAPHSARASSSATPSPASPSSSTAHMLDSFVDTFVDEEDHDRESAGEVSEDERLGDIDSASERKEGDGEEGDAEEVDEDIVAAEEEEEEERVPEVEVEEKVGKGELRPTTSASSLSSTSSAGSPLPQIPKLSDLEEAIAEMRREPESLVPDERLRERAARDRFVQERARKELGKVVGGKLSGRAERDRAGFVRVGGLVVGHKTMIPGVGSIALPFETGQRFGQSHHRDIDRRIRAVHRSNAAARD